MEIRIRERSHGGYVVEIGLAHAGGVLSPSGIGVTLPTFIVYESACFDTLTQAKRYAARKRK